MFLHLIFINSINLCFVSFFVSGDTIYLSKIRHEEIFNKRKPEVNVGAYCRARLDYLFSGREDIEGDGIINEYEKYFVIQASEFGNHNLITLSEVDALEETELGCHNVEIKLTRPAQTFKAKRNKVQRDYLQWWAQAAVGGIDTIVAGYKTARNMLTDYERFDVGELAENSKTEWQTTKCYHFLDQFLQEVKKKATEEDVVYKFVFKGGDQDYVKCYKIVNPSEDNCFLPKWFTNPDEFEYPADQLVEFKTEEVGGGEPTGEVIKEFVLETPLDPIDDPMFPLGL